MRIKIIVLLTIVSFSGCIKKEVHEKVTRTKYIEVETEVIIKKINGNSDYRIVTIDGCEYVEHYKRFQTFAVFGITHKGNCKYCNSIGQPKRITFGGSSEK